MIRSMNKLTAVLFVSMSVYLRERRNGNQQQCNPSEIAFAPPITSAKNRFGISQGTTSPDWARRTAPTS
jgi:hypothetical protein